ncbi:MAG: CPBP family intramembrane metalloprotease [Chloroflexi bacterium]|nr:CPBP family intramembrane metalloprotease [Chloroflexota bacterium]
MSKTPPEVIVATIAFIIFWLFFVAMIWLVGQRWERLRAFRARMIAQWRPALALTAIYLVSNILAGRSPVNPYALAIFCQVLIGLALARGIAAYEPLTVARSLWQRERIARHLALFVVIGVIAGIIGLLIGSVGMGIARSIFHEVNRTREAAQAFSVDKAQAFFLFLSGAGIAEETTYRLVALSFVWALTGRRWLAILVSALVFAAYHLTPLDGMYLTFLKFPISQFLATTLIGIVWGYVFVKRGYETAVLSHTLSNWIAVLLFM